MDTALEHLERYVTDTQSGLMTGEYELDPVTYLGHLHMSVRAVRQEYRALRGLVRSLQEQLADAQRGQMELLPEEAMHASDGEGFSSDVVPFEPPA